MCSDTQPPPLSPRQLRSSESLARQWHEGSLLQRVCQQRGSPAPSPTLGKYHRVPAQSSLTKIISCHLQNLLLHCFLHFSKSLINIKHWQQAHSSLPSLLSPAPEGDRIPTSFAPTICPATSESPGIASCWPPRPHLAAGGL